MKGMKVLALIVFLAGALGIYCGVMIWTYPYLSVLPFHVRFPAAIAEFLIAAVLMFAGVELWNVS